MSQIWDTEPVKPARFHPKARSGAYRVFYLARFANEILIFHAFTKKTQATPKTELALGKKRLKELLDEKD